MANNYCQMSEQYDLNPEQVKWFRDLLILCREHGDLDEAIPEDKIKLDRLNAIFNPRNEEIDFLVEDHVSAVQCQFELNDENVWINDEECVNIDTAVLVLQTMLRETNDDRVVTGTWAVTCSKPRVGEFGGGWFAVSGTEIRIENTYDAAEKAAEAMKKP